MNKQNDSPNDDNLSSLLSLEDQGSRFMQKNIDVVERDKPLWSVRQKAYAKFQLKSLQNKMDEDDKNKMMNATTSCHICKITVPLKFMNEHMNSKKHRIYIKIIDEAFQRVKKNINIVSTPQSVNTKSDSTYFCEVCCEAISIIERDIHLKSIDHGKALRYDKVLEGFLIFYEMGSAYFKTEEGNDNSTIDKCEIDEAVENKASVDKETQNISSSGKVLRPCDVDLNENVSRENNMTPLVKIEGTLNNKCAKDSLETVTEENNLTLMNEHIKTQNSNNLSIEFDKTKELKFYVAVLIITFPGVLDIGVVNENFVFISIKENCVQLHIDDFNSFSIIDDELVCLLCESAVSSKHMHMWTLKHMKNVMSPINDENCIRQSNRDKKHCVICNEMIGNVALHKRMSTNHLKRLKSALVVNRNVSDDTKLEATLPDLAANNLESNDDVKENIPDNVNDNVQIDCLHYTMSLTHNPKDLLCKVCDKVVIATPNNVSEHVNGTSHKNKYDKLLSVNRLRKVRDGFACDGCKLFIAHEDEIAHVDLKSHKNSMKKQIKNNQTYCEICYFYMDTYFYKTHKRGQRHKENAKEDRVSKRVCVDTDKKDSDVTTPVIVQSNINEDSVQTSPREVTPSVTDTVLETKNQHNEDKNLLYQMKTTPLPSCLLCIVCEDVVTNDTNNITIHLNGPNHINNYNELLKINKVVRKDSGFHCDACDVAILDKNELEHIFGGQHKNNIGDRSLIRSGNSNVVSNSQKIKPPVVERRYLFKTSENSNELMCTICNEIIPNKTTNINDHSNSEKHKTEYESLLKLNRVFDFGNVLFCQACLKYIECQKEIYHIKEPSHKASLRLFKANRSLKSSSNATFEGYEVYCSICRTWVDDFRYNEHEISENHVLNIKRVSFGVLDLQKDSPETSESCLKCKLCDCNVPNMYAFIYEHVNKFIHKLLLQQALIENELYFINQDLCCKACMVAINIEDDFNHMYKPEHLENLIRFRNDMNVNVKSQD